MRLPLLACLFLCLLVSARAAEPFEIREGDRVLFLGDTLLEREGTYGYLETRMHEQFPDRHFIVRNLSWSGETPRGWSRASFDSPDKGTERLKEDIARVRPTVVFLGFGMAASLQELTDRAQDITLNPDPSRYGAEPMSAARFKKELGELMDAIVAANAGIAGVSGRVGVPPADSRVSRESSKNGNADSAKDVRSNPDGPRETRGPAGGTPTLPETPVRFVLLSPIRHEDLRAVRPGLPDPTEHNRLLEQYSKAIEELATERAARFVNLASADADLDSLIAGWKQDPGAWKGEPIPTKAELLRDGMGQTTNGIHLSFLGYATIAGIMEKNFGWLPKNLIESRPSMSQTLRAAVIKKNELFFHQFRPANSTYLFGFRKHEQGQNAKEMPMFDPLIAAAEAEIDRLKKSPAAVSPAAAAAPVAAIPGTPPPLPDFTVEDGYQIELWAQNPLLEKPTQMNWDPQGRLWVCSSSLYPQIEPGQAANDKILVLSDTDGDGKADKSEVFADGLLIPTGVAPDFGFSILDFGLAKHAAAPAGGETASDATPGGKIQNPKSKIQNASACYVGQSTELLYFRDTDGDGRADEKRIVFSGFGTEDTHHIVHTLRWGPDGRLYFHQSVYIHTHLETPWGMVRLNAGGVLAYDPRTERVEVFCKGLWNTWGQVWDDWGQTFLTDGAGRDGVSWAFPGAVFAPSEGARRTVGSVSPGAYPKFCGLEIVKSPHFPADWQGNLITCDFRAHRIVRFSIADLSLPNEGASAAEPNRQSAIGNRKSAYVTTELPDLIRTTDLSFRPIDVRLGPDGALYVADWSNPVINHGEVDFRDPRRDHHMGRIWRITKKGAPAVKWEPLLVAATSSSPEVPAAPSPRGLLDKLLSQNAWEREQARRVVDVSHRSFSDETVAAVGSNKGALEVSLALQRNGLFPSLLNPDIFAPGSGGAKQVIDRLKANAGLIPKLISSDDPSARAAAARLVGWEVARGLTSPKPIIPSLDSEKDSEAHKQSPSAEILSRLTLDSSPRVRLEAMRALARIPTAESAGLVLDAALKTPPDDPHYDFAAWQSINDLAKPWTDALISGAWKTEGREAQLAYGLKTIDPALAGEAFSRLYAAGKVPVTDAWIDLIGEVGGPVELQRLLDGLLAGWVGDCCGNDETTAIDTRLALVGADGERAAAALLNAVRLRNARPAAHTHLVSALFHTRGEIGLTAIRLAGLWKAPDAVAKIGELLDSKETQPPLRRAAVDGLKAAGGAPALDFLGVLTRAEEEPGTRAAALVAMAQVKLDAGIVKAAEVLPTLPEGALLGAWRGLLGVKGAPDAFAVRLAKQDALKALPAPVVEAAIRAAREIGRPGAKLLATLVPQAAATAPTADYLALAENTKQNGDPAKGELVYRRATSACVTCHAIGGAGGKVGPDLTSIGASAPLDYLIESLLNPNAKVKEGYNAVTLTLLDGEQVTGIQARETAAEIILRDAIGTEKGVPKAQIKGKADIGSMMPAGLTATLQPRESIDLYAFLSQLGKPGPYDASKGQVARVWRLYPGTAAGEVVAATYDPAKNPGFPGYTLVDGRFVKDLLTEAATIASGGADTVLLATQFQSSGKTRLKLTGAGAAWLDGQPLALGSELAPELPNGTHTLVVKLAVKELPAVLRAESEDARFLGN